MDTKTRTLVPVRVRVSITVWARALLFAFALMLAYIVLLPSDGNEGLGLLQRFSRFVSSFGAPYSLVFHITEFTANIVLFVPVGVLIPLAFGRADQRMLRLTVLAGALLSITIELTQLFIPGRVSSVFDVFANTLGTLVGVACVAVLSKQELCNSVWRIAIPAQRKSDQPAAKHKCGRSE